MKRLIIEGCLILFCLSGFAQPGQTINFPAFGATVYGDADINPGATATSGLTVTYTSGNTSIATIVSNKVHIIKAGTVTIYADQAGNGTWDPAPQVSQSLTIDPKTLTITATGPTKTYGTALAAGTSANFTHSGEISGEAVTSVTLTPDAAGASATTAAGVAYVVTPSLATGTGGFLESNYNVTYNSYNGTVAQRALTVTANNVNKTYGSTLTGGSGSSAFSSSGLQNSETIGSVTIAYGTGSAPTDVVATYNNQVIASAATGGSFTPSNYSISYFSGNIIVGAASLTITANDVNKTYGSTLTGASGSTAFISSGLQNGETIGTVTIAYGTGSAASAAVNTYTSQVTPSAATGGTFTPGNYSINYVKGNIIVGMASLTITSYGTKNYGSTLTSGSGKTTFNSTGLQNGETIGSVTITYGTGSAAGASVGTYSGQATGSAATGGTFTASNYSISYSAGDITVNTASLSITANAANKTYGSTLTGGSGSTAFTSSGLQNSETIGTVTVAYGTGSAAAAAVGSYTGQVTISAATGGTFTPGNYSISYWAGNIIVGTASLTITANDVNKTYGSTLTGASGSTAFISSGLQNGETIGTVTLAYGTGSAAAAAVNTYTSQVTPSAATGGTFTSSNYNISYVKGNIIVGAASLTITPFGTKTYGLTLSSGSGKTTFHSVGLQNGETIGSLTIAYGTGSAAGASVGTYSGQAIGSAATGGTFTASNYSIIYAAGDITVTPASLTITANNVNKTYGNTLTGGSGSGAFTSSGLQNGETIGTVTITYGTGSAATASVGTYTSQVTPSAATGGTFTASNYSISYAAGNIIVGTATLTVTANSFSKQYKTTYTFTGTEFTTSGLVNSDAVTNATLSSPGAASNANVIGSPYTISISNATGTGLTNYNINYVTGLLTVTKHPITITVTATGPSKTYGTVLAAGTSTTNFTVTGTLASGESITSVTLTPNAAGSSGTLAAGGAYTVTPSAATGSGGFLESNYTISYVIYNGTVSQAPLTITATNVNKTYGSTLTGVSGSTAFTSTGLQNSETIGTVSISYGTGSAPAAAVGTYSSQVTPSAATGGTFSPGNYLISYSPGNIIVGTTPLTVTANDINKTYGSILTGVSGSSAFTSSGLQNGETIGTVTMAYGTGSASTAPVGTYSLQVTPSAATGGTFTASNYSISYAKGGIIVGTASLTITPYGTKTYGSTLTSGSGQSTFNSSGLQNGETVGSVTITFGTGTAATAAVGTYTGQATGSSATGGTFTTSNYSIAYIAGNITVTQAPLTVTANNINKLYGATLTGYSGSTAFATTGLKNSETVGTVTVTYGTGSSSTDAVGTYLNSVTPSSVIGGTFSSSNYSITYSKGRIYVQPKVAVNTQPASQHACEYSGVVFSNAISGVNLKYLWQYRENSSAALNDITTPPFYKHSGEKSASLSIDSILITYNGYQFTCKIVSKFWEDSLATTKVVRSDSTYTGYATLTIDKSPPPYAILKKQGANILICLNKDSVNYIWGDAGGAIANQTNQTYSPSSGADLAKIWVKTTNKITGCPTTVYYGQAGTIGFVNPWVSPLPVTVSPNPNNGTFTVKVTGLIANTTIQVIVLDYKGTLYPNSVKTQITGTELTIQNADINKGSKLPPGIYFIDVIQGTRRAIGKIIVNSN